MISTLQTSDLLSIRLTALDSVHTNPRRLHRGVYPLIRARITTIGDFINSSPVYLINEVHQFGISSYEEICVTIDAYLKFLNVNTTFAELYHSINLQKELEKKSNYNNTTKEKITMTIDKETNRINNFLERFTNFIDYNLKDDGMSTSALIVEDFEPKHYVGNDLGFGDETITIYKYPNNKTYAVTAGMYTYIVEGKLAAMACAIYGLNPQLKYSYDE